VLDCQVDNRDTSSPLLGSVVPTGQALEYGQASKATVTRCERRDVHLSSLAPACGVLASTWSRCEFSRLTPTRERYAPEQDPLLSAQPDLHRQTGVGNTTRSIASRHTQPVMCGALRAPGVVGGRRLP